MKKFIKSYYPLFFTSIYMFMLSFSVAVTILEPTSTSANFEFLAGLILGLTLISVIGIFVMMISYMIHAAKSLKGSDIAIWIVLIWFANVFIMPYYNFKFIQKRNDSKTILVSQILSYVLAIIWAIIFVVRYI